MGAGKSTHRARGRAPARPSVRGRRRRDRARAWPDHGALRGAGRSGRSASSRRAFVRDVCGRREPAVVALGGGAVETRRLLEELGALRRPPRRRRRDRLDAHRAAATGRSRGTRPSSAAATSCAAPLYREVADAVARDADDVVLAAAGVHVGLGALELLGSLVPGDGRRSAGHGSARRRHPRRRRAARARAPGSRRRTRSRPGRRRRRSPVVERLWRELRIDRRGDARRPRRRLRDRRRRLRARRRTCGASTGCPSRRRSSARSTRRSAARRRSTCRRGRTSSARSTGRRGSSSTRRCCETLPERERREGMAEVVKTGLLPASRCGSCRSRSSSAGARRSRRRCACATRTTAASATSSTSATRSRTRSRRRPATRASRTAGPSRLGLLAALRLSGRPTDVVEEVLAPRAGPRRPRARLGGARPRQEARASSARRRRRRGGTSTSRPTTSGARWTS